MGKTPLDAFDDVRISARLVVISFVFQLVYSMQRTGRTESQFSFRLIVLSCNPLTCW